MNLKCMTLALAAFLTYGYCQAQTNSNGIKEDFKPSVMNQPGQDFPQVNSQGYARFRIKSPNSDSIRVSLGLGGQGGTLLAKGADGFFYGNDCRSDG